MESQKDLFSTWLAWKEEHGIYAELVEKGGIILFILLLIGGFFFGRSLLGRMEGHGDTRKAIQLASTESDQMQAMAKPNDEGTRFLLEHVEAIQKNPVIFGPEFHRWQALIEQHQIADNAYLRSITPSVPSGTDVEEAIFQIQEGHIEEAIQILNRLLEKQGDSEKTYARLIALAYTHYGMQLFRAQRWGDAQMAYLEALEQKPSYEAALAYLGLLEYQMQRSEEAKRHYQKAIRLDSEQALYRYNLAKVYIRLGKYSKANAQFKRVLTIEPNFVEAYNELGKLYLQTGQFDEAKRYFEEGLKHSNENTLVDWEPSGLHTLQATFYKNLALLKFQTHQWAEAIKQLGQALEIYPITDWQGRREALYLLARLYTTQKDPQLACSHLQKFFDLPTSLSLYPEPSAQILAEELKCTFAS